MNNINETNILQKIYVAKANEYYNIEHYDHIIRDTAHFYKSDNTPLFHFIKNGVENREKYKEILKKLGKSKTKNRGSAAGVADIKQFPKGAVELLDPKSHEKLPEDHKYVSVKYKDSKGKICSRCQSNIKRSACAGYFDNVGALPCRAVGWTTRNPEKQLVLNELAENIDKVFKGKAKFYYDLQKKKAEKSKYLLGNTIFSTMTINYDFRTACHKDKGDFKEGLSTLTIFEDIPDNYYGFYIGFPEYKVCIDMRDSDILIFDAHEYHANTEYLTLTKDLPIDELTGSNYAGRISVVTYLRNRLDNCPKEFNIFIPSYDRPKEIREKTLKTLKKYGIENDNISICVSDLNQKNLYDLEKEGYNVVIGGKSLVDKRNFMRKLFNKGQKVISMDDDLEGFYKGDKENKLIEVENLKDLLNNCFIELKNSGLNLFGFYPVKNHFFMSNEITRNLKYISGACFGIIIRKDKELDYEYDGKEDMLSTLKHYRKDKGVLRFNNITFKTKYYAKGGMNTYDKDRIESGKNNCEKIKKDFPEYISSIYQRKNKLWEVRLKRGNFTIN